MKYLGTYQTSQDLIPKSELPPEAVDVSAVLLASGWAGSYAPYTQRLLINGITADSDGIASLAPSCNSTQREEARRASLSIIGQSNGEITIVADGEKPLGNIPVTIIILG